MKSKKINSSLKMILLYLGVQFIPVLLLLFVSDERKVEMTMTLSLGSFLLGAVLMLYLNSKKPWTPTNSLTSTPSAPLGKVVGLGVGGFVVAIFLQVIAANLEYMVFDIQPESTNTQVLLDFTQAYPLYIFSLVLFAPILEELVFRKAIMTPLIDHIGVVGASVVNSLIFAFIHMDGHLLIYGSLGLWFSYLYYRTRNIATPILAHALMNAFASLPLLFY